MSVNPGNQQQPHLQYIQAQPQSLQQPIQYMPIQASPGQAQVIQSQMHYQPSQYGSQTNIVQQQQNFGPRPPQPNPYSYQPQGISHNEMFILHYSFAHLYLFRYVHFRNGSWHVSTLWHGQSIWLSPDAAAHDGPVTICSGCSGYRTAAVYAATAGAGRFAIGFARRIRWRPPGRTPCLHGGIPADRLGGTVPTARTALSLRRCFSGSIQYRTADTTSTSRASWYHFQYFLFFSEFSVVLLWVSYSG